MSLTSVFKRNPIRGFRCLAGKHKATIEDARKLLNEDNVQSTCIECGTHIILQKNPEYKGQYFVREI